VVLQQ
jgi:hypothetical protein